MLAERPLYSIQEIMRILPHRPPFLLVDRVEEIVPGNQKQRVGLVIRATKNVTMNEPFFVGHFPHRPVMPGVLQIECMAQVAALSVIDLNGPRMDVAIAGVNSSRFRKPVVPGDTLNIECEIVKDRGSMFVVKSHIKVRGELVSEAEILAVMFPLEAGGST